MRSVPAFCLLAALPWILSASQPPDVAPHPDSDSRVFSTNGYTMAEESIESVWRVTAIPETYQSSPSQRQMFERGFRHGYTWSFGLTPYCPTNPNDRNQAVMHGWIIGWKAGVKRGGTNGLPSKYAPYIAWQTPEREGSAR